MPNYTGSPNIPNRIPAAYRYTASWNSRVYGNGGVPEAGVITALKAFEIGLATDGLLTTLAAGRMNIFAGGFPGAAVPFFNSIGTTLDTPTNFVSGDYALASGLTGNGSTKRIDTGVLPFDSVGAAGCLGIYARTNFAMNYCAIGANNSGNTQRYVIQSTNGTTMSNNWGGTTVSNPSNINSGLWTVNRVSSTSLMGYRNGVNTDNSSTSTTPATSTVNLLVFARNNNGTPDRYYNGSAGMYFVCGSLNSSQQALLYTRIQTLMTAFGRQV